MHVVGSAVKRLDDPRLVTGRGRYVDDLRLPRLAHAAILRSPHAHARLVRVDLDLVRAAPGVLGALAGPEAAARCRPCRGVLLHYQGMKTGPILPLAVDRVRYAGEPVAVVAAETRAEAEDALALALVEYEPLRPVLTARDALSPDAPVIHPELGDNVIYRARAAGGDAAAALARAARVYRRTFVTGRHTGVPMEPRGLVADFDSASRALTVWMSTQVPHMMRAVLAELFDVPEHRVRVVAPDVGGSFGIKIHVYQDDLAACALALSLGRPLKFVAGRRESFLSDIHAREQTVEVEVGALPDGTVTGMGARITAAVGPYSAYPRSSVVEGGQVLRLLPGPYRVRDYEASLTVVAQTRGITSQYRAVGHPIAALVTESMLDEIAADVGLDPAEMRRRNLIRPDELPWTSATGNVYDSGSYHAALERLLEAAGYAALRHEQAAARAEGRALGIGLACFVELTGPGAQFYGVGGAPISGQEGATLRLEPSGAVTVLTGLTDQGQGMSTAVAQIVAEELGLSVEDVAVVSGDTAVVPYGGGTWASRGMPIGGAAALLTARALGERIRRAAAVLLEAAAEDVVLRDGRAGVRGSPDRSLSLRDLARAAHFRSGELKGLEPSLEATVHFTNPVPWTFTNGAHLAAVEVDLDTGAIAVTRYVAVDDCGRVVNPALTAAQAHGGIAQGIGGALWERSAYDDGGQLITASLMDYAVPTAAGLPSMEVHHVESPAPSIPGGFKGAGEAGTTGAPAAVLNAVNDALAPLGARLSEVPLVPERVWQAIQAARRRSR